MSVENDKTVEVYESKANVYLKSSIKHDNLDLENAKNKRERLENLIKTNIGKLPKNSRVLEIGSADGTNAKYIEDLGYDVTASDVAGDFIKTVKSKGLKTIKFNVLKDKISEKYSAVFCWRVFVHFTQNDIEKAFKNIYDMLENGGLFIFNVINSETRNVEEEWVDFANEYHMGDKRYYKYFSESEISQIATKTGYQISYFHKEGGDDNKKWLVYVLKK